MRKYHQLIVACVCAASFVQAGWGQIRVDYYDGTDWVNSVQLPVGSDVTISDTGAAGGGGSGTYRVYTLNPATQSIGNVRLYALETGTPALFIGRGLIAPDEAVPLTDAGAYNIGSITSIGGKPRLQARVVRDFNGEIGFWHIVRLDAHGIMNNVTHKPEGVGVPPRLGIINAYQIGPAAGGTYISAAFGDINRIAAAGSIYSSIESINGSIGDVTAGSDGGAIIASKSIRALNGSIHDVVASWYIGTGTHGLGRVAIEAKNGIHLVRAGTEQGLEWTYLSANIRANANNGAGNIARVESVYPLDPLWGHFYGSITANNATGEAGHAAIRVDGDFHANVTLASSFGNNIFIGGRLMNGYTISIGGSLLPTASIYTGYLGWEECLAGQIIINAGGNGGTWSPSAVVSVYGTNLAPGYTQPSSQFGGGAIGEAPFNFHGADCEPVHGALVPVSAFDKKVVIRHDGPIFSSGSGPVVRVLARAVGAGQAWFDCSGDFKTTLYPGNHLRSVLIEEAPSHMIGFAVGFEYVISPVTDPVSENALRCLMTALKPPVRDYQYRFTLTQ